MSILICDQSSNTDPQYHEVQQSVIHAATGSTASVAMVILILK